MYIDNEQGSLDEWETLANEGKLTKEPVRSFSLTIVVGKDTKKATQIVMEGCVLNGVPGLIFDSKGEFSGMDEPNPNVEELAKYGPEVEPLSMPVRKFSPGKDIFIDLKAINERIFADIAGLAEGKTVELIGRALSGKNVEKLEEIEKKLREFSREEERYYAGQAIRICKLLDQVYPNLFNGSIDPNEITAPWMKRIGRIALVDVSGVDPRATKGIILSLIHI